MSGRSLLLGSAAKAVALELTRCQRNIDRGGAPRFWLWRLRPVLVALDEMAAAVRARVEQLEKLERESRFYICNNCGLERPLPYYALVGCDVCWHKSTAGVTETGEPAIETHNHGEVQ